jgi:hypothetical protein
MASLINGPDVAVLGSRMPLLASPPPAQADPALSQNFPGPRANHMAEADAALELTPQEKFLYNTHLQNLNGTGKIVHPDGSVSSLLQMSFEQDGRFYNIPTVVNGKQLAPTDAIQAAERVGLDKFPSYDSAEEAESRYDAMHDFLGRDTADFIAAARAAAQ